MELRTPKKVVLRQKSFDDNDFLMAYEMARAAAAVASLEAAVQSASLQSDRRHSVEPLPSLQSPSIKPVISKAPVPVPARALKPLNTDFKYREDGDYSLGARYNKDRPSGPRTTKRSPHGVSVIHEAEFERLTKQCDRKFFPGSEKHKPDVALAESSSKSPSHAHHHHHHHHQKTEAEVLHHQVHVALDKYMHNTCTTPRSLKMSMMKRHGHSGDQGEVTADPTPSHSHHPSCEFSEAALSEINSNVRRSSGDASTLHLPPIKKI